jgi:hypothetical protein
MPRPQDILAAFVPEDERPGFPFSGWQDVYGSKRCFHVPGFTEACEQLGVFNRAGFGGSRVKLSELLKRTRDAVPKAWVQQFGAGNSQREQDWKDFGLPQIMTCFRREPMLLQKAMLSLVFLEQLVVELESQRRAGEKRLLAPGYDVYEEIRIAPAIYYVPGFDKNFYDQYLHSERTTGTVKEGTRNEMIRRLKWSTGQDTGVVFDDIAKKKRTCLYATAAGIIEAVGPYVGKEVLCKGATTRSNGTASKYEVANFPRRIPKRSAQG